MSNIHTPGPWAQAKSSKTEILAGGNAWIASARWSNEISIDKAKANAQLIAAAPELLDALQVLAAEYEPNLKTFAENAPRKAIWQKALAAIAKASGGVV